jgi:hypothetical protein
LEEFDWTGNQHRQNKQLSSEILKLIELKLEFNVMHVSQIVKEIKKIKSRKALDTLNDVLGEAEIFLDELLMD